MLLIILGIRCALNVSKTGIEAPKQKCQCHRRKRDGRLGDRHKQNEFIVVPFLILLDLAMIKKQEELVQCSSM